MYMIISPAKRMRTDTDTLPPRDLPAFLPEAERLLGALRALPGGEGACRIGTVGTGRPGKVVLHTALGGSRILGKLTGAQLPRIC